jgi:phospholipase A-2-activating protein
MLTCGSAGCADKFIRIFRRDGKLVKKSKGGNDVVRALCRLPPSASPAQFASAGNDAIIRLWTLDGAEVAQLHGHENFIYSLTSLPSGELVSSSEDRTVRIWRGTDCIQTITHPAISIWSVAVCKENGDIVTGASDKIVRIFSRSAERHADAQTIAAFEESVKASAIPQQAMGDINKEQLPGPEFLTQKSGTKEGQVQMIKEYNGNITAHQWSSAAQQWLNVGTVVDSAGGGDKKEYMGKQYDYVFDVDIAEGAPPLKLPYNLSQNPYEAARKFIEDNELPLSYLDQVAGFITSNTKGATIGQSDSEAPQTAAQDPWGTSSRYRPGEGGPEAPARPKALPQREYLSIVSANFPAMTRKIQELNTQLVSSGEKGISLNPSDVSTLSSSIAALETSLSSTATSASPPNFDNAVRLAIHISTKWSAANRVPGLDLYRLLAAVSPSTISAQDPVEVLAEAEALSTSAAPTNAPAAMLALRFYANMFKHDAGKEYASAHMDDIVAATSRAITAFVANRNVLAAAMTVAINYAVLLSSSGSTDTTGSAAQTLMKDAMRVLSAKEVIDSEVLYRGMIALGTFLSVKELKEGVEVARVRDVCSRVEKVAKEPRLQHVCTEVRLLL